ncbi:hypothetical protein CA51_11180 [Rosistilla oblonga]|uniref:hypothetical protein n=1 Tax=Rosistilla oblonga TaxID=2527990 RepID=UPI00118978FD|nr:hypothetical protein [Rosistilla oblonga]QDV11257.1 hypothetical protein CA51_11180 [Rosistilla oblonga]
MSIQQTDLFGAFDRAAMVPGNTESKKTRRAAYDAAKPKVSARSLRALAFLHDRGSHGATREEIAIALGTVHHAVSSITGPLIKLGLASETTGRRETSTGTRAVVLVATSPREVLE